MNKLVTVFLGLIVINSISACNNNQTGGSNSASENIHENHNDIENDFAHKKIIVLEPPYIVSDSSKIEFERVLTAYFALRDALFEGNIANTDTAAIAITENIKNVSVLTFNEKQVGAWMQHKRLYIQTLTELLHVTSLEDKRSYFSHITEILYCSVKSFHFSEQPVYVAYCTMAFEGKGAFWLTSDKTIRNPYYGTNMPNCGEITEAITVDKSRQ